MRGKPLTLDGISKFLQYRTSHSSFTRAWHILHQLNNGHTARLADGTKLKANSDCTLFHSWKEQQNAQG